MWNMILFCLLVCVKIKENYSNDSDTFKTKIKEHTSKVI